MKLTIGIATYNREDNLLKTVHTILPFLLKTDTELVIYNDGGSFTLAKRILDKIIEDFPTIKLRYSDCNTNHGVFYSKMSAMYLANNEWYIHLDDDDSLDMSVLSDILLSIEALGDTKPKYAAVQFNVSRLYYNWKKGEPRWFDRLNWIRKRREDNARTLVGMLFHLPSIRNRVDSYFSQDIATWKSHSHGWGDDVFIAGYLTQDYDRTQIGYCDLCMQFQTYNDEDYHISTDNSIPRRVNAETRPYLLHSKLGKLNYSIEL